LKFILVRRNSGLFRKRMLLIFVLPLWSRNLPVKRETAIGKRKSPGRSGALTLLA
jgi:hypothetical protein